MRDGSPVGRLVRMAVPPSMRFASRQAAAALKTRLSSLRVWGWELVRLKGTDTAAAQLAYVGHRQHRAAVSEILGVSGDLESGRPDLLSPHLAIVSELPWLGALKIPRRLHMVVPLARPLADIVGGYDRALRRHLRRLQTECRRRQVTEDREIDRLRREMLIPYALARHGDGAVHYSGEELRRMATEYGRLDLTYRNDEEVGCRIGFSLTRNGKKYWVERWFGYPESVFSDAKALSDANSINSILSIAWAIENGYDFYDMGGCIPRPEDGNLRWKRRRGGSVDTLENSGFYYLRPPREERSRFFWTHPLFAVERGSLTLHLGIARGVSSEEMLIRFREMRFPGIARLYLYCHEPPSEAVTAVLCGGPARHAAQVRFEAVLDG